MQRIKKKDLLSVREQLVAKQGNRCAVCGIWFIDYPSRDIVVDHCHVTGNIRGALCRNCNRAEGKVRTQCISAKRQGTPLKWLYNLLTYLMTHHNNPSGLIHPTHKTAEEKQEDKRAKARVYYARKKARLNIKTGGTGK